MLYKNNKSMFYIVYSMVFILFCDQTRHGECSNGKYSILSICSRLGSFPQIFGQVKEWLMFELCGMIKVTHIVACPMDLLFWRIEYLRIAQYDVK